MPEVNLKPPAKRRRFFLSPLHQSRPLDGGPIMPRFAIAISLLFAASAARADEPRIVRENIEWLDVWVPGNGVKDQPRVLLIGDSITRGYYGAVENALKGKAIVCRLATSKSLGDPGLLDEVKLVLGQAKFDVVHFNNGMHGWGYTEDEYAKAIPDLVAAIRKGAPGAKLVCGLTTPVRVANKLADVDPKTERVKKRNASAVEVMTREKIPVNDLFAILAEKPEWFSNDGVHLNAKGSAALGEQVAAHVLKLIGNVDVPVLEITKDTVLDPAKTYGRIIVKASDVSIDGKGAWVIGGGGDPKTFKGIGIEGKGVNNVKLKNVNVKGFETGLRIEDGRGWLVDHCDFSDNFHDPDFGWGENGRRGGILLVNTSESTISFCKANRVWDGCVLDRANNNTLKSNDFSRCSNTCLKLWRASKNLIEDNKLDYGIRIKPGEVHARDSTCVLIETGSDFNTFRKNSCTYGGDGIFIRPLNNWQCTGNRFEKNDCSFANNNGFECWSPGNSFIGNTANHCSYGFWMGGSDRTVLDGNEASWNGDPKSNHNSPHLPKNGHAGIVFMFGSGTHVVVRNNTCLHNNGAGIAVIGDQGSKGKLWKASHWVIDGNMLRDNRWGVFAEYADWLDLGANTFKTNLEDVHKGDGVTNLTERPADAEVKKPPTIMLDGSDRVRIGEKIAFDASKSTDLAGKVLSFRWDLGDGTTSTESKLEHTFKTPGLYRVGVTVTNGSLSSLDWRNVYVVPDGAEIEAGKWDWVDSRSKVVFTEDRMNFICGKSSAKASVGPPYSGGRCELRFTPEKPLELVDKTKLRVWIRARNPNVPSWQDGNPLVSLHGPGGTVCRFKPKAEMLSSPADSEARDGWLLVTVPLRGDPAWTVDGKAPDRVEKLSFGFDSWGAEPFEVWLDGLMIE
jgi:parallel beta-helix repeat protein